MSDDKLLGDMTADLLKAVKADRISQAIGKGNAADGCTACKHRQEKLNELHRWYNRRMKGKKSTAIDPNPITKSECPDCER